MGRLTCNHCGREPHIDACQVIVPTGIDVCPLCEEGAVTIRGARNEGPAGYEAVCSDCGSTFLLSDDLESILEVLAEQPTLWKNDDDSEGRSS